MLSPAPCRVEPSRCHPAREDPSQFWAYVESLDRDQRIAFTFQPARVVASLVKLTPRGQEFLGELREDRLRDAFAGVPTLAEG